MINTKRAISSVLPACIMGMGLTVAAQSVVAQENFYEGKTVSVVIRGTPGGGYDTYGRLVARHIGKHIPGNPDVIPVNRPGAGGLVATNYMYNRAPQDGTEFLIPARSLALSQRVGLDGVRYDVREFQLIGSAASGTRVYLSGPDVPVESLADLENFGGTFSFSVSGAGAGPYQFVQLLQEGGFDVDMVTGYEGTSDQVMAVLRNDTHGTLTTYASSESLLEDEGFKVFAKLGNAEGVAEKDDIRDYLEGDALALANVMLAPLAAARPFMTGPGVPEDRVKILQEAFRKTIADPEFRADAEEAGRPVAYTGPDEMRELYDSILDASDDVISIVQ